jgi:large subunit ribosomal protein L29
MKTDELREMTIEELRLKIDDSLEELFNLRFQKATNRLENPLKIKAVKKDIARVMTIIRDKQIHARQKK